MFGQHARTCLVGKRRRSRARLRRAGGFRAKLITLLAVLLILIGVLPIIIAKTALRNVLVSLAIPKDTVRVNIGEASLSWFSAASLSSIEVKDCASGNVVFAAESIHCNRTPLSLALNSHDLGTVQ